MVVLVGGGVGERGGRRTRTVNEDRRHAVILEKGDLCRVCCVILIVERVWLYVET